MPFLCRIKNVNKPLSSIVILICTLGVFSESLWAQSALPAKQGSPSPKNRQQTIGQNQNSQRSPAQKQNQTDQELADRLRSDLEFELGRRKAFADHLEEDDVFDDEREQGLSLFLEEDERWNRLREKGAEEQRKARQKPMNEESPEYFEDLRKKQEMEVQREKARERHVRTKELLTEEYEAKTPQTEEKEFSLGAQRPRYELRLRGKNKWLNAGKKIMGGSGSGSAGSSFDLPPLPSPAPGDYMPPPSDSFEDIPPPPPPVPYDPNFDQPPGFDSGFGDIPPPPPPPNDPSWDF